MNDEFGIIPVVAKELRPTLWRTARALANADRLKLMRLVSNANGAKGVSEIAAEAGLPVPTASIYLRILNARGLISVVRLGRYVYYGTGSDRSLPVAIAIQKSFRSLFAHKRLPGNWTDILMPTLRAYSSPRREAIMRILLEHPQICYSELLVRSGMCEMTFLRHLGILATAGMVVCDSTKSYSLAKPRNSLESALSAALRQ